MKNLNYSLWPFLSGFIFGIGLLISGMTDPNKVLGFLDLMGSWDPSLMFVMVGAISVYTLAFRIITRRPSPTLASHFQIPQIKTIDFKLVMGSSLFGIGWGLAGFCPGPALVSLTRFSSTPLIFTSFMLLGMLLFHLIHERKKTS